MNEVVKAAYGAFGHGLDLALLMGSSLLLLAAIVAAVGLRGWSLRPESLPSASNDEPAIAEVP